MSTQLEQILAYLDKDGVSEVVVAVGRPIAMRQKGAYVNLTARPLTTAMLWAFVEGSSIAALIPHEDGSTNPTDLDVGKRRLRIRTGRRGNEIVVRIEKGAARIRPATKQPPTKVGRATGDFELPVELDVPELPMDALTLDDDRTAPPAVPGSTPRRATPSGGVRSVPGAGEVSISIHGGSPDPARPRARPPEQYGGLSLDLDVPELSLDAAPAAPVVTAPVVPAVPPPEPGTFAAYVAAARAAGASDLHIAAHRVVAIRTNNELVPVDPDAPALSTEAAEALLLPLLSEDEREQLQSAGYVDLPIDAPGGGRLRANISRHPGRPEGHVPARLRSAAHTRGARSAQGPREGRLSSPGPRGDRRAERSRQDHDARRARRPRQLDPAAPHPDRRGSDRDRASPQDRGGRRSARSGATPGASRPRSRRRCARIPT